MLALLLPQLLVDLLAGQLERLLAMLPDLLLEELLVSRPSEVLLEPGLELLQAVLLALLPPTLLPMASAASLVEERARARARMVRAKERAVRAREKAKEKGGAWTLRRSVSWQIFLPLWEEVLEELHLATLLDPLEEEHLEGSSTNPQQGKLSEGWLAPWLVELLVPVLATLLPTGSPISSTEVAKEEKEEKVEREERVARASLVLAVKVEKEEKVEREERVVRAFSEAKAAREAKEARERAEA